MVDFRAMGGELPIEGAEARRGWESRIILVGVERIRISGLYVQKVALLQAKLLTDSSVSSGFVKFCLLRKTVLVQLLSMEIVLASIRMRGTPW